eukprot:6491444-Amphidinium_carterae.2
MASTSSDSLSLASLSPLSEDGYEDEAIDTSSNGDSSCSDFSDGGIEAQRELINMLLRDHECGRMSAKTACTVAYWCYRAGLQELEPLALSPEEKSSGNFQKRLDKYVASRMEDQVVEPYYCNLPVYVRATAERACVPFPVMPPNSQTCLRRSRVRDSYLLRVTGHTQS